MLFRYTHNDSSLQWRDNGCDGVSNHQPRHCLLNHLFRRRSKKTSKFRVTGLCAGNSPVTDEFPAQMASNAENISLWWRHHGETKFDDIDHSSVTRVLAIKYIQSLWNLWSIFSSIDYCIWDCRHDIRLKIKWYVYQYHMLDMTILDFSLIISEFILNKLQSMYHLSEYVVSGNHDIMVLGRLFLQHFWGGYFSFPTMVFTMYGIRVILSARKGFAGKSFV